MKEEVIKLKRFKNYCTCGGYAWSFNGRPKHNPHMSWCPQKQEYDKWWKENNILNNSGDNEENL